MKKKVIVLGGDGFCGWPTSLYLSSKGYDVTIVDNLSRREIDKKLKIKSLTPIKSIKTRLSTWEKVSKKRINFHKINISKDYKKITKLLKKIRPDNIIHFAEQRAAPYSMKSSELKNYTINNNINGTHHILSSIVKLGLKTHLIHLGTMGVYGYDNEDINIPEGYINVTFNKDKKKKTRKILFPQNPGSIYHLSKCIDQLLFMYYAKNDELKITDLHQGIVWGSETKQTSLHPNLINRFDYDGDYGTVLNRFLIQAALNYPLTIHGTGSQSRAFININDTVKCIELAIKNPPIKTKGKIKVKILNQSTEVKSIIKLAKIIKKKTNCKISYLKNPRNESNKNELSFKNSGFKNLGLKSIYIKDKLLQEINSFAKKYILRCDKSKIPCISYWNNKIKKNNKAYTKL